MYLWIPTVYRTFLQEGSFNCESCTTYFWNCNCRNNNFTYSFSDKIFNWECDSGINYISFHKTEERIAVIIVESPVYLWRNLLYFNLYKLQYSPRFINFAPNRIQVCTTLFYYLYYIHLYLAHSSATKF